MVDSALLGAVRTLVAEEYWFDVDAAVLSQLGDAAEHRPEELASVAVAVLGAAQGEAIERFSDWVEAMCSESRLASAVVDADLAVGDRVAEALWPSWWRAPELPIPTLARLIRYRFEQDVADVVYNLIVWHEEPVSSMWPLLAELFDAAADDDDELLRDWAWRSHNWPWAREDPRPADGTAGDRHDLFSGIPPSDPDRVRAALEADAVDATTGAWLAAGRSPLHWLERLGWTLAGCATMGCCRFSLFEAELMMRGYLLRHRPAVIPAKFASP